MGVFDLFSKGFNQRSKLTHVKLVEPSVGRIVELQVTEQDDCVAKYYMGLLTAYGEGLEQLGVQWKVTDKTIRLTFADSNMAEDARQIWKR